MESGSLLIWSRRLLALGWVLLILGFLCINGILIKPVPFSLAILVFIMGLSSLVVSLIFGIWKAERPDYPSDFIFLLLCTLVPLSVGGIFLWLCLTLVI